MGSTSKPSLDKVQQQYQDTCHIMYGAIGVDAKCHLEVNDHGQTLLVTEPVQITTIDIERLKKGEVSMEPGPIEPLHSTKHTLDQLVKFDATELHQIINDDPKILEKAKQLQHWFDGIRSTEGDKPDDPSGFMEDPIV